MTTLLLARRLLSAFREGCTRLGKHIAKQWRHGTARFPGFAAFPDGRAGRGAAGTVAPVACLASAGPFTAGRDIVYFESAAKPGLRWELVSCNDYGRGNPRLLEGDALRNLSLIPYCFDFERNQLVYAVVDDPVRAAQATFHFTYLREHAKGFVEVPVEYLPARVPDNAPVPVILFSVGRCGSTLLTKLLNAMGAASVSEPDFFTQAALNQYLKGPIGKDSQLMFAHASHRLLDPLVAQGARPVVLKMRSQVNFAPWAVLSIYPRRIKTIFMTRNFQHWCESVVRAFGTTPESNLAQYFVSLDALRWLRFNSDCMAIEYEDVQGNAREVCGRLAEFLQLELDNPALDVVLNMDSQVDTPIARKNLVQTLPTETVEAIGRLWSANAPRALIDELGLRHL